MHIIQNLYSIIIGILLLCLFIAFGLAVKKIERKYNTYYLFLVTTVIGSFVAAIFLQYENIPSISYYAFWEKVYAFFTLLEAVFIILLISELTGFKPPRIRFLLIVPIAVFFVINLLRPFGLYFDTISAVKIISLPFGISYNSPVQVSSIFISIVSVYVLSLLIFVIYSLRFAYTNNRKGNAILVIFSFLPVLLLSLIANFIYQSNKGISGFGDLLYDCSLFFFAISIGIKNFRDVLRSGNVANSLLISEEKYRLLFEHMEEGFILNVIITDNSGKAVDFRFLEANAAFEKLIGFERKDFIGKTYRELFPNVDPVRIENYGRVTLKGLPFKEEFFSDAIKKYLRTSAFYHHKDHFAVIYEDITEQKKAEESLRNSEKQFSDLMAALPDIVFMHKDGKIVYANQTASIVSGYSLDELLGSNILNFIAPEHHKLAIQNVQRRNAGEEIDDYECKFILKSGAERTDIVRSTTTLYNNEPVALTILFDITDRLEDENKLRESELRYRQVNAELSKINAEKDKMFSIIAHDLRGPFHGILGLTNVMMDVNRQVPYNEIISMNRNLNESANKLYNLMENLLEWSRFQQGLIKFNPIPLNLASSVDRNISTLNELADRKEITVLNNIPSSCSILADEEMFNIVIRNLLSNALKFSFRRGYIRFSAIESDNDMIQISVNDDGTGISPNILSKLFHIDEKVSKTGTEGEQSSGLGLILCKEFVEKQNGKIWVDSIENSGSTFYFTIPKFSRN